MERIHKVQIWRKLGGADTDKEAELANTYDMPLQPPPKVKSLTEQKTASAMSPHVDVSGLDPVGSVLLKTAKHYAMPSQKRYALDSYGQVKQAAAYFDDTFMVMPPADRHEFCQNLCARSHALGIPVSPLAEKYGSASYASDGEINMHLAIRRSSLLDSMHLALLDKVAALRKEMAPEDFAITLQEFDKAAGLDLHYGDIPDAYYSTFGKTAAPEGSVIIGNEYITRERLGLFLGNNVGMISKRFGEEIAQSLAKDPQGIFDSLPRDQKLVLMRMANNDDSPVQRIESLS